MTPTHAKKNGTRYSYYVSRSLLAGASKDSGQRIPASNLETLIRRRIHDWLADRAAMLGIFQTHTSDAAVQKRSMASLERWLVVGPI